MICAAGDIFLSPYCFPPPPCLPCHSPARPRWGTLSHVLLRLRRPRAGPPRLDRHVRPRRQHLSGPRAGPPRPDRRLRPRRLRASRARLPHNLFLLRLHPRPTTMRRCAHHDLRLLPDHFRRPPAEAGVNLLPPVIMESHDSAYLVPRQYTRHVWRAKVVQSPGFLDHLLDILLEIPPPQPPISQNTCKNRHNKFRNQPSLSLSLQRLLFCSQQSAPTQVRNKSKYGLDSTLPAPSFSSSFKDFLSRA